jgi:hypothetical protein
MISNHVITGVVKILKRDGKDLSVHKKAASDGDIHKLYTRGVFHIDNPKNFIQVKCIQIFKVRSFTIFK